MLAGTPRIVDSSAEAGNLPSQTGNAGEILTTDGSSASWAPGFVRLSTTANINAKTVAVTSLYTVPADKKAIITAVIQRVTAFTVGSKTIDAVVRYGANNPDFDDWLTDSFGSVTANNVFFYGSVGAPTPSQIPIYAAASVFSANIETGSNATTETWAIDVFGYLIDA